MEYFINYNGYTDVIDVHKIRVAKIDEGLEKSKLGSSKLKLLVEKFELV